MIDYFYEIYLYIMLNVPNDDRVEALYNLVKNR